MFAPVLANLPHVFPGEAHPVFTSVRLIDAFMQNVTTTDQSFPTPLREAREAAWRAVALAGELDNSTTERQRADRIQRVRSRLRRVVDALQVLADRKLVPVDVAKFGRSLVSRVQELLYAYPTVVGPDSWDDERFEEMLATHAEASEARADDAPAAAATGGTAPSEAANETAPPAPPGVMPNTSPAAPINTGEAVAPNVQTQSAPGPVSPQLAVEEELAAACAKGVGLAQKSRSRRRGKKKRR
jgi:hypothetical protein